MRLVYRLTKDWIGPFDHPDEFHPVVLGDYLEFTGENALVRPELDADTPATVFFDWSDLPASWALATSFGTGDRAGSAATEGKRYDRCQTFSGRWRSVVDAVYAAGDFRIHHFTIGRRPAILAIRGSWVFSDSAAINAIQATVGAVRDFWHDDNFPYFLVAWSQFDHDRGDGDGTAFTNALWMFTSRLDSLPAWQLTTLTHEAFHAWDPRRMGREPDGEERRIGWFHEGFTAYYGDVIAYRRGLVPLSEVVDDVNHDLSNVAHSTSSYTRGRVIALWLDGEIRSRSEGRRSLDDVMYDMVRGADKPLTLERILETASKYVSADDQAILGRAAAGDIDLRAMLPKAGALAPCVRVTLDSAWAFDAGFDVKASTDAKRVTGVRVGGPAYAAGLRDGQPLLGRSIYNGQAEKLATFTIQADSGRRRISYYPRGAGGVVPQLHIAGGYAPRPGACGLSIDN